MENECEIILLGARSLIADGLKNLLEARRPPWRCVVFREEDFQHSHRASSHRVVLFYLDTWHDMLAWREANLLRVFRKDAWIVISELRIAGLYLSQWQSRSCRHLIADPSVDELLQAISQATDERSDDALEFFEDHLVKHASSENHAALKKATVRECECACGIALHLGDKEIGEAICISEPSIRMHICALMHKLKFSHRRQLASLFEALLACPEQSAPNTTKSVGLPLVRTQKWAYNSNTSPSIGRQRLDP